MTLLRVMRHIATIGCSQDAKVFPNAMCARDTTLRNTTVVRLKDF
tara:strand:- start:263 stop:397 length:135 start_codon:yes stop_codon:yes gene_type:complete